MLLLALALAVPALAVAQPGHGAALKAAVRACVQERKQDGRQAFAESYGRPALPKCVRQTLPEARNAAQKCRDERDAAGVDAFRAQYGVPSGASNAFGKCVSGKVSHASDTGGSGTSEQPASA
jgi:hypothetical protein